MKPQALALLSGGLDSELAAKIVMDCGVRVVGLHLVNAFGVSGEPGKNELRAARVARELGIELELAPFTQVLSRLAASPAHGYGSNMNPCIDCRIEGLKLAWKYANEAGAAFLITGEVLGQRPMSQRREAIALIEKEAGVRGKVLRPLSAHHLPPTEPEKSGLVDRSRLLGLTGRSRKPQLALAGEMGLKEFASPAGGCLLTDPTFSGRV